MPVGEKVHPRGEVKKGKTQVNWRISTSVIDALRADCPKQGLGSIPALVNHLLTLHYFGNTPLKGSKDR